MLHMGLLITACVLFVAAAWLNPPQSDRLVRIGLAAFAMSFLVGK